MKRDTAIETTESPAVFRLLPEDRFAKRVSDLHELIAQRAYQLFATRGFGHADDLGDWLQAEAQLMKAIPLELSETPDTLKIKAFLRGYCAEDIEIHLEPRRLFISGRREPKAEPKEGTIIYAEQNSDRVFRCIDLPRLIDPKRVRATLHNGELEIELAKAREGHKLVVAAKAA
jgi:HSP20 family molecular chaperone IbpA